MPVGLSDHTMSSLAAIVSTGLGMDILEKHLTLSHGLAGPDHTASAEPLEFAELVRVVRLAERMAGSGIKGATASEVSTRRAVRRTLLYARDLAAGHVLEADDMEALRCGLEGLAPEAAMRMTGRALRIAARAGTPVGEADLQ